MHKIVAGSAGHLHALAEHCARLERVSVLVAEHLPEPLDRHCGVANIDGDVLVLYSEGAGWTTRLRFHTPRLLDALKGHPGLGRLREIRVRPALPAPRAAEPVRIPHLPATAAAHLAAAAMSMGSPALRAALLRLAARGQAEEGPC